MDGNADTSKNYNNRTNQADPQTKPGTVVSGTNQTKPTAPTEPQTETGSVAPENDTNPTNPTEPPTEQTEDFETKSGTVAPSNPTGIGGTSEEWFKEGFNPYEWFSSDFYPEAEKLIANFSAMLIAAQVRMDQKKKEEIDVLVRFIKDLDKLLYDMQSFALGNVEALYNGISLENWQSAFNEVIGLNEIAEIAALDELTSVFGELYVVLLTMDTMDAWNRGDKERFDENVEKLQNEFKDMLETEAWKEVFTQFFDNLKPPPTSSAPAPAINFDEVLNAIGSFFEELGNIIIIIIGSVAVLIMFILSQGTYVPAFQNGGFIAANRPFIAREAGPELIGTINGRTAVANNSQIVTAVSSGVSSAFLEAFYNQEDLVNVEVFLDGRQLLTTGRAQS